MKTVGVREAMPSGSTVMRVSKDGGGQCPLGPSIRNLLKTLEALQTSGGCLWDLHHYIHYA